MILLHKGGFNVNSFTVGNTVEGICRFEPTTHITMYFFPDSLASTSLSSGVYSGEEELFTVSPDSSLKGLKSIFFT